jgi:hypothetical protein
LTNKTAAVVSKWPPAAESLRQQAHKLSSAVAGFKLDGVAAVAHEPPHHGVPLLQPSAILAPHVHAVQAQRAIQAARPPLTKPVPVAAPAAPNGAEGDWDSF